MTKMFTSENDLIGICFPQDSRMNLAAGFLNSFLFAGTLATMKSWKAKVFTINSTIEENLSILKIKSSNSQNYTPVAFLNKTACEISELMKRNLKRNARIAKLTTSLVMLLTLTTSSVFSQDIDIALKQFIDNSLPAVGGQIKYKVYLINQGINTATAILVNSQTPYGAVSNVIALANGGTALYNAGNGLVSWTVPSIVAGDSLLLEITANAITQGVFFNISEVMTAGQYDIDSDPGNRKIKEDDIASTCFSIPITWYPEDEYMVSVPASFKNGTAITWFKNNIKVDSNTIGASVNQDSTLTITSPGSYTFETQVSTCPASGCCPLILIQGPYGSIGNYVWEDVNFNGRQDSLEGPIVGIKVYLLDSTEIVLDSTVTNSFGNYLFDSLLTGNYKVQLKALNGSLIASKGMGTNDTDDSDINLTTGKSGLISIDTSYPSGAKQRDNSDVDAGIVPLGSIGHFVWLDTNGNGQQNDGESGIVGIRVYLLDGLSNKLDSTLTGPNGQYLFDSIKAGTYKIQFIATAGSEFSLYLAGNSATNSDAGLDGISDDVILNPKLNNNSLTTHNLTIDAGIVPYIFDLAITKAISSTSPYTAGSTVSYHLIVSNEGDMNATQVQITDAIPTGLTLADTSWSLTGNKAVYNIPTTIRSGGSITIPITFNINSNFSGNIINSVEISKAKGPNGENVTDDDSVPNNYSTNEDDDDTETIIVDYIPIFDLTLKKTVIGNDPFTAPGLVTYNLLVTNQGEVTATFVKIVDYVPTGFTLLSNNWTMDGNIARYDQAISLLPKASTNVQITFAISPNATGDIRNEAEISSAKAPNETSVNDIDSTPDDIKGNDGTAIDNEINQNGKQGGDEDDHDYEIITIQAPEPIFDLALIKTVTTAGSFTPGSPVKYKIEVINQGELDATFIKVVDIVPSDLILSDINWSQNGDTLMYVPELSLAAGKATNIFVNFTVAPNVPNGLIRNHAEIASAKGPAGENKVDIDSTPDKNPLNDGPQYNDVVNENGKLGGDEDDSDFAEITITAPIFDLALNKVVATQGPYVPGQTLTYNIQVQNQGELNATNILISDNVPTGLTLKANNGWSLQSGKAINNTPINLSVAQGTITIPISFTINNNFTGSVITNIAEIKDAKGPNGQTIQDKDSLPNNGNASEDDQDDAQIEIITDPKYDLSLKKEVLTNGPIYPGSKVTYAITVFNEGDLNATLVKIADMVPTNLTIQDTNWHIESRKMVNNTPFSISPGLSKTINITFKVTDNFTGTIIQNSAEIFEAKGPNGESVLDEDSNPNNNSINEDDDDTAGITISQKCNPITPIISSNTNSICFGQSVTLSSIGCNGTVEWSNSQTGTSIVVSPISIKTYTAHCKVDTCISSESNIVSIVVTNPATPSIFASRSTICSGEVVTITSTSCSGTVRWSNGMTGLSINVTPIATSSYSATCKAGSCVSNISNMLSVTVGADQTPTITASTNTVCAGESTVLTASNCTSGLNWSTGSTANSITVSPTATTIYSVICGSGTCAGSGSISITLGNPPIVTITASKALLCKGESTTLTASSCDQALMWNTGSTTSSITVEPTATQTYTVTCGTIFCVGIASQTITVGTDSAVTITANNNSVCAGETVALSATGCSNTLTWSTGQTGNNINATPTQTTLYTASCGTDICAGTGSININVGLAQTPIITASTESICGSGSVTLTITNCSSSINWSTGAIGNSITVSPTTTTTYTVLCGTANCSGTASKTIPVGSSQTPTVTASNTESLCSGQSTTLTALGCTSGMSWNTGQTTSIISVTPASTTTYTATCSGTCGGVSTFLVNVINSYTAPVISASAYVLCQVGSVTLTAKGCNGTVIWSNAMTGTTINVNITTNASFTATCSNGTCISGSSNSVMEEIITALNAPVISSSASRICTGERLILNGLGCDGTVKWSNGETGSSITVTPSVTTVYTATCMIGSCESQLSAPTTINVGSPFPPQISSQSTLICLAASVAIKAEGCVGTVVWSTGQIGSVITVSPTAMTSYSAICKGSTCQSEKSNVVTIGVSGASLVAPTVTSLTNNCPVKTVNLSSAVTSTPKAIGGSFIFTNGNYPNYPLATNLTSIATSGSYYVFENGGNGCYSAGSKIDVGIITCEPNVDCIANPATASAGTNATICLAEDFYQLNGVIGGSAVSGTWTSNGNGTFSNATALNAKYNYSVEDLNKGSVLLTLTTNDPDGVGNCTAVVSSLTLTINAIKTKPSIATSKSPVICLGDSVILTVNETASKYLWDTGATTKSIVVKKPGAYTVKLINEGGCSSLTSNPLVVTNMAGIASPTVKDLAKNTCPTTSVNLTNQLLSTPVSNGGVFEFHTGITTSSQMISNVSAMPTGNYYVFEKSTLGCYSNPSLIKVIIDNCEINTSDAEVAILKTGSKTLVSIGDEVTYTIKVTNNGASIATNVTIEDLLPDGLEIVGNTLALTVSGNKLITTIASIAVNESKSFVYKAKVTKSGTISNVAKIVALDQTDPIKSNNVSQWDVECSTSKAICIATALNAKKELQGNSSYNIQFTSLVSNCGNAELTGVGLIANMAKMYGSTTTYTMIQPPTVNAGSALEPNLAYNGGTETSLLKNSTSVLSVADVDTVMWIINLVPNGTQVQFSVNSMASGIGMSIFNTPSEVTDVSNDGLTIIAASDTPSVVKLYQAPGIGLSLAIIDTVRQQNRSLNVVYQAIVENNGELALKNVIISDTLSKTYVLPVTYTIVSTPTATGGLIPNPTYNGKTDVNLTLPASTMAINKKDTVKFIINVLPNNQTSFVNQAIAQGTGTLAAGDTETVKDLSNTGYNPYLPGSTPTILDLNIGITSSVQTPCIGVALYVSGNNKLADGSFDITYTSIIRNCGNVNLSNVSMCDTLGADFDAPSVVTLKKAPSLGLSSTLALDNSYNGINNICMLNMSSSSIAPNKSDTIKWTVNLTLNSNNGPFRKNVKATAKTASDKQVSDISNDGKNPSPEGEELTILNFNNLAPDLIGIAKELISIEALGTNLYDVVFKFNVRNYGIIDFTGVQVQDNLAETFGPKVIIDSISIFDVSTGFTINPGFTGKGLLIDLLDETKSSLPVKTTKSLSLLARIDLSQADTSRFENVALAVGYQNGTSSDDLSNTGSNPDPEADGTPENNSIPTLIDFGSVTMPTIVTPLGIAKAVSDTVAIVDGSYEITYTVIVKNYGDTILSNVQLLDSLYTVFGDSTDFILIGTPKLSTSSTLMLNAEFDGVTDFRFLVSDISTLAAGESGTITFKVKVRNNSSNNFTYNNSVYGTAISKSKSVTDQSNSGLNPDSDSDNNPGNNNTPTPLTLKSGKDKNPINVAVLIPGGISPNGDGINDVLIIEGISMTDEVSLKVYNRWGEFVFVTDNYKLLYPGAKDGWAGKSNLGIKLSSTETNLPDGTYFYSAESKNQALFGGKPHYSFLTIAGGTKK